jgi:hypothetical protein
MPTDIQTDTGLLARLLASSHATLTRDQLRRQRISFIYGGLPEDSTITRLQIEQTLDKAEGVPV